MKLIFTSLVALLCLSGFGQAGTPLTTFGNYGKVTTAIGSSTYDEIRGIAIQPDGKIVASGISNGSNRTFALARYNPDGTLDNNFDGDGKLVTAFGSSIAVANAVAIQSDGKIVVAGQTANGGTFDYALLRYNADGSLDNSFGVNGKLVTVVSPSDDICLSIAIQSDGKIVVAGNTQNGSNTDFCLVRCLSNGVPDNSFGINGKVITPIGSGNDGIYSLAIQKDGKILAAGFSNNGSNNGFALARYNSNGSLDNTFGTAGKITTSFGPGSADGHSVELQADGKIIVAGRNGTDFLLARYTSSGVLDNTFDGDGKATISFSGPALSYAMKLSGYRIYVAGTAFSAGDFDFALVTLMNDASPLPLSYLSFTAIQQANAVKLSWQTTMAEPTATFLVERSGDGVSYKTIGTVKAANAMLTQNYYFVDGDPLAPVNYYRLKTLDAQGKSTYSSVVVVKQNNHPRFDIYPNPAHDVINVQVIPTDDKLQIRNAAGFVVKTIFLHKGFLNSTSVDVHQFPSGIYFMQTGTETVRFIKE